MSNLSEREKIITEMFGRIRLLDLGPYNYWYLYIEDSVYCYLYKRYIASILASSATVETILFWEYLKEKHRGIKTPKVIPDRKPSLSKLIKHFKGGKLPINELLDENEDLDKINIIRNLNFIKTRNKFSHGDLFIVLGELRIKKYFEEGLNFRQPYPFPSEFEKLAYMHLLKTLNFISEFLVLKTGN